MNADIDLDALFSEMLTPEQFEELLKPLSEEQCAGEDLRYDDIYDQIEEARREDDPDLPQGEWKTTLKKADWKQVEKLCLDVLQTRSKDVQVATWLTEAWIHIHGFLGLYAGSKLLLKLCQRYWQTLYPALDEEDIELRISPLIWMNNKFFKPLSQVLITAPNNRDIPSCSFLEREEAWALEIGSKQEKAFEEQGKITRAKFLSSLNMTAPEFFQKQWVILQGCQKTFKELTELLDEHCGTQAPSFSKITNQLETISHIFKNALADSPQEISKVDTIESSSKVNKNNNSNIDAKQCTIEQGLTNTVIRSRREAYQCLAEAADYLQRTEPHSPVPYLVKRAVSWGNLSLQELLMELVNDQQDLAVIYQLLDIRSPSN